MIERHRKRNAHKQTMIEALRKITSNRYIAMFMLIACMAMWFSGSGEIPSAQSHGGLAYDFIKDRFAWAATSKAISLLLFLAACFMLYEINMMFSIIKVKTSFHLTLFLFIAAALRFNDMTAGHYSAIFIMLSILFLFYATFKAEHNFKIFQTGAYLSVASVFYAPSLWLIPVYLLGIAYLNMMNIKSFWAFIVGLIFPYWIISGICLYTDNWQMLPQILTELHPEHFFNLTSVGMTDAIAACYMLSLTLCGAIYIGMSSTEEKTATRSFLHFFLFCSFACFLLMLIYPEDIRSILFMQAPFTSIMAARFFVQASGKASPVILATFIAAGIFVLCLPLITN